MRILLSLLIGVMILTISLTGCSDSSDSTANPAQNASITPTPEPSPEATDIIPQKPELKLTQGKVMTYAMSGEGGEFGSSRYEVISEAVPQDIKVYTIEAILEMASTCPVTPTTGTATLQVDQFGIPISYLANFSIGQGWTAHKQSVDCQIDDNVAHIIKTVDGVTEEIDVQIAEGTFLFDPNLIGWFAFVYGLLDLETGKSIEVPVLSPGDLETRVITIAVRPEMQEIEVNGMMQQAFVCDLILSDEPEVHYVMANGTLLKIEGKLLSKSVTIELAD